MTGPPPWPPNWPPPAPAARPPKPPRPADVDTGFWLWLTALPVLLGGFLVKTLTAPDLGRAGPLHLITGLITLMVAAVVVTFLILMRAGYQWARTILTGGGVAAVVYALTGLFDTGQHPAVAVIGAFTGIIGSVLIAGGTFLLHRKDAQGYFTR